MKEKMENYRKYILIGLIIIVLGATFTATMQDTVGYLGTVCIAVGSLFFIIGMSKKRKENEKE